MSGPLATLTGVPRIRLPPAQSGRCDDPTRTVSHRPSTHTAPRGAQLRREENRRLAKDRVRPPQLTDLTLELGEPDRVIARGPGPQPLVDLGPAHPGPQRFRIDPELLSDPAVRARPGRRSILASIAIRVARSRNSTGYFRCADMGIILPGNRCLHQTRCDSTPPRASTALGAALPGNPMDTSAPPWPATRSRPSPTPRRTNQKEDPGPGPLKASPLLPATIPNQPGPDQLSTPTTENPLHRQRRELPGQQHRPAPKP
ncbi:hypothetical protein AHiyo1_42360 [Arthrobacter sp. Hiyo1]|nr:hypothetical protein AHiyo1_42360 [Arthrobacter sp. Hiyo1]